MRKRNVFGLFLAMLLAVTMVTAIVPMGAFAVIPADPEPEIAEPTIPEAEPTVEIGENDYFALYNEKGELVASYDDPYDAEFEIKDGYTLKMVKDYKGAAVISWRSGVVNTKMKTDGWDSVNTNKDAQPASWTFDGNGHTWDARLASSAYVWTFDAKSYADKITIKNVTLVSNYSGINFAPAAGLGFEADLIDVKIYAGNMYEVMEKRSTNTGNAGIAINVAANADVPTLINFFDTSESGVDNTVVYAYSGAALASTGIVSIHGGKWFAPKVDATIDANGVKTPTGRLDSSKIYIYDGEFYNSQFSTVRAMNSAQVYIIDGKFVNTVEFPKSDKAGSAVVRTGAGSSNGYATIVGGEFWMGNNGNTSAAAVYCYVYGAATILGGTFHYQNAGKPYATHSTARVNANNPYTIVNAEENLSAAPATETGLSSTATNRQFTVSAPYKTAFTPMITSLDEYYAATVNPADPLPEEADVAIFDKAGNLILLLDADAALFPYSPGTYTTVECYTDVGETLGYSTQLVPDGGKWVLLLDEEVTTLGQFFRWMPSISVEVDGRGHTIKGTIPSAFLATCDVRTMNMHDIKMTNTTTRKGGSVLQIANDVFYHDQVWTLTNVKLTAGSGTAVCLGANCTLNLGDGTEISLDEAIAKENGLGCELVQVFGNCVVNVNEGSRLYHPGVRNRDGVLADPCVIFATDMFEAKLADRSVWFALTGATVNLNGGALETKMDTAHFFVCRSTDTTSHLSIVSGAKLTYNSSADGTGEAVTFDLGGNANGAVQILDKDGAEVAVVNDLWQANALVQDGYTVKLIKDLFTFEAATFDGANINLTIDGNGFVAHLLSAGKSLLDLVGSGSKYTVKNFSVDSSASVVYTGADEVNNASEGEETEKGGMTTGSILAIVEGAVIVLLIAGLVVLILRKRKAA